MIYLGQDEWTRERGLRRLVEGFRNPDYLGQDEWTRERGLRLKVLSH